MSKLVQGYDVNLVSSLPMRYKCPLCKLLLRDAIQTFRGELACEKCYKTARQASSNQSICPIDGDPIDDGQIFQDKHARRQILQLPCYCKHKDNGCKWEGVVHDAENHEDECIYVMIPCPACKGPVFKKDLKHHQLNECAFRTKKCEFCFQGFVARDIQEHEAQCTKKPRECPYGCRDTVTQNNLYEHVKKCAKLETGKVCPYVKLGCKHEVSGKKDLQKHVVEYSAVHAALSMSAVDTIKEENEALKQQLQKEISLRKEMEQQAELDACNHDLVKQQVARLQENLTLMEKEFTLLKAKVNANMCEVLDEVKKQSSETSEDSFKAVEETFREFGKKYQEFEQILQKVDLSADAGGSINTGEIASLRENIETCAGQVEAIESNNAILSAIVSDLELKLQLMENTNFNGRQLWKIDNIRHRMQQAVTGQVTALHSAPCYTSRHGYKFCSRIYLNGDGMGKGTHVSLFFVVMRSEYDALLPWPFTNRVTFRLINPVNDSESIRESFLPDRNSSSFKRPIKDMNIAAGCPLFVRKDALFSGNFIIDDSLFMEICVSVT